MNNMDKKSSGSGSGHSYKTNSEYLDSVYDTEEDSADIQKAYGRVLTDRDKKQIAVLALLNCLCVAFIGVFLLLTDSAEEYDYIKEDARFDYDSSVYLSSAEFAEGLTPNYADTKFPPKMMKKYEPLYSENNDVAGWLRIPGTNIDHVVLKGKTNDDYIRSDFYHKWAVQGSIFMDYRNKVAANRSGLSKNTIVYGHRFTNRSIMFAQLSDYLDINFYREHPVIEMDTLYNNFKWKIFGAFITNVDPQYDNGKVFYYWYDNFSDANTVAFANEVASRSYFINPSVDILPTDKFLTLSTCTHMLDINGIGNARMVVVARLVRSGETAEADVSAAYENPNVKMPQVWYDKQGLSNPYAATPVWDPFAK